MNYRDLLPLDSFLNGVFLPALDRCNTANWLDKSEEDFDRLVLMESVSWLSLGAELSVFPLEAAQKFCSHYSDQIRVQRQKLSDGLFWRFFRNVPVDYLNPVLAGGDLFVRKTVREGLKHQRVGRTFEIFLELVSSANQDRSLSSLCPRILMYDKPTWTEFVKTVPLHVAASGLITSMDPVRESGALAILGAEQLVQHVAAVTDLLSLGNRPEGIGEQAWSIMRRSAFWIHHWRFDLGAAEYYDRLGAFVRAVFSAIIADATDRRATLEQSELDLYDLRGRWLGLEGAMTAVANR